jgi:xanthine dehydrogenase accessory factor
VTGTKATIDEIDQYLDKNKIPIIEDPYTKILSKRKFDIVIDARMIKKNLDTKVTDAPIVIGLGPGFHAGTDCHAVVETLAGRDLGRVIYNGPAHKDTGTPVPKDIYSNPLKGSEQVPCCSGFSPCTPGFDVNKLVLRAPCDGVFKCQAKIGDKIQNGQLIGWVNETDVVATADGLLRGLIHNSVSVTKGLKIGDIDPNGDSSCIHKISEKSNAIAGGVLEACLYLLSRKND